jgi:hypothetical protein
MFATMRTEYSRSGLSAMVFGTDCARMTGSIAGGVEKRGSI